MQKLTHIISSSGLVLDCVQQQRRDNWGCSPLADRCHRGIIIMMILILIMMIPGTPLVSYHRSGKLKVVPYQAGSLVLLLVLLLFLIWRTNFFKRNAVDRQKEELVLFLLL